MRPILFDVYFPWIGKISVLSYDFFYALSISIGIYLFFLITTRKYGLNYGSVSYVTLIIILLGFLGARIFYVIQHYDFYFQDLSHASIALIGRGTYSFGYVIGGILGVILGSKLTNLPSLVLLDSASPSLALGDAIARIGCFLNGCCYGSPCSYFWCVQYPVKSIPIENLKSYTTHLRIREGSLFLHPVQLYESSISLLMFVGILVLLRRNKYRQGKIFALWALGYGIMRFAFDFLRGDVDRGFIENAFISLPKAISLGIIALALFFLFKKTSKENLAGSQ